MAAVYPTNHEGKNHTFLTVSGAADGGVSRATQARRISTNPSWPPRVLVLGPPGSGKGTQCAKIAKQYGLLHISTGDLYREEVARGTEVGKLLAAFMQRGDLVPDDLGVGHILRTRLAREDCVHNGWLGDGWTRERANSESLLRCGIKPDLVFLLTVPRETSIRRLLGRRHNSVTGEICNVDSMSSSDLSKTCLVQRADDNLEAVCRRVDLFTRGCAGALQPLREALVPVVEIDGEGTVDEVFARIIAYWPEHVPRSPL